MEFALKFEGGCANLFVSKQVVVKLHPVEILTTKHDQVESRKICAENRIRTLHYGTCHNDFMHRLQTQTCLDYHCASVVTGSEKRYR